MTGMQYEVKAVKPAFGVTALVLEAASEGDARAMAAAQGFAVLDVRARSASLFKRQRFPLLMPELFYPLSLCLSSFPPAGQTRINRMDRIQRK